MSVDSLLIECLLSPERAATLAPAEWESLVCQGQAAGLLGRLLVALESSGRLEQVPPAPRRHLEWTRVVIESQKRAVRWEADCLRRALADLEQPFVLLKGAAYVLAGLPAAQGRLFGDVDILVAREELATAEALLERHGWVGAKPDAYDQRYFRDWMHELPPLRHGARGTILDVHHGLLPVTARLKPDADRLRRAARPIPGEEGLWTLAPVDMVLHAACHLFHEGEFQRGLRDLMDLDSLLRHFGSEPGFWADLIPRAREMDLGRPLHYALRTSACLLATPIAPEVLEASNADGPPALLASLMDQLFLRVLGGGEERADRAAAFFLYLRAHAQRMPPHLLLPHLARKSWRALFGLEADSAP
ncbi:MAG: nucleotidyltransferase family protein [Rhodocyclaceae bacterium]|nr:nucleotidyltransferase family protein [Rhodocyclaceae bacterium]